MSDPETPQRSRDDLIYRRYLEFGSLVNGGRIVPNWFPDGSSFWFRRGAPNEREILWFDPSTSTVAPLFDVARIRAALRELLGYEVAGKGIPFEHFEWTASGTVSFALDNVRYELDLEHYQLTRHLPLSTFSYADLVCSEAERNVPRGFARWKFYGNGRREPSLEVASPDGRWMAGIADYNLVLRATVDGQAVKVTTDGTEQSFWDVEGVLWYPWSPDGMHLLVLKQHTEGMPRIPSIQWLKPREQIREVIGIPAGGTLYRSELYLLDLCSQLALPIDLGDTTNQYLRPLSWLPDSSGVIVAQYNRVFSRVELRLVNARSRTARTLLTEECATFLTTHFEVMLGTETGFTLLPEGAGFLWKSERSGWDHLYHYDMQGRLVCQLTSGDWRTEQVIGVDHAEDLIYFTGHGDRSRPYDTHLYRANLTGEGLTQLTEGKGQHTIHLSPSARYFTDTYSAVDVPPKTVLRHSNGTLICTLGEADVGRLHALGWVAPEEYVVKAADGITDLWITAYFPYRFDPEEKYPVIESIYAGPQAVARPTDFGDQTRYPYLSRQGNFIRALAHLGFVILTLDGRGTPGRSKAFQDAVYKNWGQFEIADHAGALKQLGERLAFLDLERVGVLGESWGGHFAFRAMTQAPDLYRVGICQVPSFDPRRMPFFEPYLGMPQENKVNYDRAEAFGLAPQLKGELLLIGGMNDPYTQSDLFKMSEALIRMGKQHRTMCYPYSGHLTVGQTAEYDMELKKRFFVEHLLNA